MQALIKVKGCEGRHRQMVGYFYFECEGGRCLKQALTIMSYRRARDSGEGCVYRGVPALDRPRSPAPGGWGFFAVLTSA